MHKSLPPLAPPEPPIRARHAVPIGISAEFLLIGAALLALILA